MRVTHDVMLLTFEFSFLKGGTVITTANPICAICWFRCATISPIFSVMTGTAFPFAESVPLKAWSIVSIAATAVNGTDSANGKAVPVITEKIGDIVAHLNQQIAQIGLAVVITVPPFRNENSKVNSITSWLTLMIQDSELVLVNQGSKGTQIQASGLVD